MKLYVVLYLKHDFHIWNTVSEKLHHRFSFPRIVPEEPWLYRRVFLPYIHHRSWSCCRLQLLVHDLEIQTERVCSRLSYLMNYPPNIEYQPKTPKNTPDYANSLLPVYMYILLDKGFPSHQQWKCWCICVACFSVVLELLCLGFFSDSFFNL